jgi:hypothetical protein
LFTLWDSHLDPKEFESALSECEIANRFLQRGTRVEFVPRQDVAGKRTPDLRVWNRDRTIEVECKLKSPLPVLVQREWEGRPCSLS